MHDFFAGRPRHDTAVEAFRLQQHSMLDTSHHSHVYTFTTYSVRVLEYMVKMYYMAVNTIRLALNLDDVAPISQSFISNLLPLLGKLVSSSRTWCYVWPGYSKNQSFLLVSLWRITAGRNIARNHVADVPCLNIFSIKVRPPPILPLPQVYFHHESPKKVLRSR
jgi:hypothetical protein